MGCTAWARRMVPTHASDRPIWRTLPSSTSSASAPTVSSIGVAGIDPVLVVEVDVVGSQAPERALDGGADIGRTAVEVARAIPGVRDHAELRGEHDLVTATLDRLADQLLVGERPVDLGGVEKGHPEIEGTVDRPDGLGIILPGAREGGRHPHGPQPDAADVERSECGVLHSCSSLRGCHFDHVRPSVRSRQDDGGPKARARISCASVLPSMTRLALRVTRHPSGVRPNCHRLAETRQTSDPRRRAGRPANRSLLPPRRRRSVTIGALCTWAHPCVISACCPSLSTIAKTAPGPSSARDRTRAHRLHATERRQPHCSPCRPPGPNC